MATRAQVKGYREFLRACDRAGKDTKKEVRSTFREVGEVVREPWALQVGSRLGSSKSAAGLRTSVRTTGVSVRQSLRKVTGKRSDWGRTQQRIGDKVADANERQIVEAFDHAIDKVADRFDDKL